jgi:AcrR family transcriptional regulator
VPQRAATPPASARRRRSDGELTRRRVLDAAVESILESGYYHTSSNEIARRAGVTWGTLQHQFGSREALLLEVLNDWWADLQTAVATAKITGTTLEERLACVLQVLAGHYGKPAHLAQLQILLDLTQNPTTSAETRKSALEHGQALSRAWQPLFHHALGEASKEPDLVAYAFTTLRGYLVSDLVSRTAKQRDNRVERDLLVRGVAAAVRDEAHLRGIEVD